MNGRRLASAVNSSTGVNNSYTYDADGLRLTKTVNGVQHKYVWQGSQLVSEYYGGTELEFFYDESGAPYAFSYKANASATPVMYYYVTNLQGDVTNIVDASGNVNSTYTYNAWGKIIFSAGTMSAINPLRYRGYYYDSETGLYYLQSRYYDPEICRFVNADGEISGVGGDVLGYNMFAYCMNNPVNMEDLSGNWPKWSNLEKGCTWLAVGIAAICAGVSVLTCGVAAPAMMAVAAVTVGAGALTAVNGAAEIQEAFTERNFVRDTVFSSNQKAYDTYATATAAVAAVGAVVSGGWTAQNAPRIKAYKSMDSYNVKNKHLSSAKGSWSKFNTTSQTELRALGKEALKNTPMNRLTSNSSDSYKAIYDFGRTIGTSGQTSARLIFSTTGKIITFFPD